jgi:hypothetical protein
VFDLAMIGFEKGDGVCGWESGHGFHRLKFE